VHSKLDILAVVVFGLVQWRINARLLREAQRRLSGPNLAVARGAIILFNVVLICCYVLSFSRMISYFRLDPRRALFAGAAALGYLMAATFILVFSVPVRFVKRLALRPGAGPTRRKVLDAAGLALVSSPLAVLGYGYVQRTDFHVREVDIPVPGLPADLDGLRLLQLSDIHLSAFLSEAQFARVVDAANELRPHLALVTGDLISSRGDPLDACLRQLARLRSDAGIYGCLGNHERFAGAEPYATAAGAKLGVQFLRGQNERLRFGHADLNVAGVDYQSVSGRDHYLSGGKQLVIPGAFNLLLSHNPDVFPVAAQQGYQLVLAGHTHGGQVNIEILDRSINPAHFLTPFVYGLYREGTAAAYVTRGIGTIGIPARIGAPPEISLLRLRKA
jgi:predicted MPP superfamily phosphohydrolase